MELSPKQLDLFTWWIDPEADDVSQKPGLDGIIAEGAIRAGKTYPMGISFIIWATANYERRNFIMAGKTINSFRRNVMSELKPALLDRGYDFKENREQNLVTISYKGTTNYFYLFGGRDEKSQDLVQGLTAAGAFLDETTLQPESFVNQVLARCSVDGSKLWFNCNPGHPDHWFKRRFLDRDELNLVKLHFDMDDNPSLSEAIKERYRKMYTGVFYKRYILGLWVKAEGLVYDMFDRDQHVIPDREPSSDYLWMPVDYGTSNAFAGLLIEDDGDTITVLREYYYSGRDNESQKTDGEYYNDLQKMITYPVEYIVDPSAASFITLLRRNGEIVHKAKNQVLDGIRRVSSLLANGKIKICKSCVNLIEEFGLYSWDPVCVKEDKPIKEHDHALDALRYYVYTCAGGYRSGDL